MLKKIFGVFISILFLLPSLGKAFDFSLDEAPAGSDSSFSGCNENDPQLFKDCKPYFPAPIFCLATIAIRAFSDQGFVKAIFRPPTSIL